MKFKDLCSFTSDGVLSVDPRILPAYVAYLLSAGNMPDDDVVLPPLSEQERFVREAFHD